MECHIPYYLGFQKPAKENVPGYPKISFCLMALMMSMLATLTAVAEDTGARVSASKSKDTVPLSHSSR